MGEMVDCDISEIERETEMTDIRERETEMERETE